MITKVLIDDDILIQLGQELRAEKEGYNLDCYYSIDEFLQISDMYPKEIEIFVDSDLGTATPGEVDSERIAKRGFKNIFLNTGYTDIDLSQFPWIKRIHIKS